MVRLEHYIEFLHPTINDALHSFLDAVKNDPIGYFALVVSVRMDYIICDYHSQYVVPVDNVAVRESPNDIFCDFHRRAPLSTLSSNQL